MMNIFGDQKAAENFDAKVAGQPREEKESSGQAHEQVRPGESEPQTEEKSSTGQADNDGKQIVTDEKRQLADKFNSREDLIEGLAHIGDKLGRSINRETIREVPTEALEEEYKKHERELGQTSDVDLTRKENQRLKQQNEELNGRLEKLEELVLQQGEPQDQARDPNTGQFTEKSEGESRDATEARAEAEKADNNQEPVNTAEDSQETIAKIVQMTLEQQQKMMAENDSQHNKSEEVNLEESIKKEMLKAMRANPVSVNSQGENLNPAHFQGQAITEQQLEAQKRAAGIKSNASRKISGQQQQDGIEEQIRRGLKSNSLGGTGLPL